MSVRESHPLRRLRPFGCPALEDSAGQAPLTPPSPLKVSNPFCPGGGRGARSAPLSAPTRPPSPIFAGNVNVRALRATNYDASRFALAQPRLRGATEARCVGAPCSPPANTARRMATSQTRQPAPLRRKANVSRSASGAQARASTWTGQNGPRDTRRPRPEDRPPRAVGCARPSLASSLGRGKPPRQLTALGGLPGRLTRRLFTSFHSATLRSATRPRAPTTAPPKQPGAAALPPRAVRDASLRLHFAPLRENRRDRRGPRPAHHRA